MTQLSKYLSKETTKPVMTIEYTDSNVAGRIYVITGPIARTYKYSIPRKSYKGHRLGSWGVWHQCPSEDYREQVAKLQAKGWEEDFIYPESGYEIQCLTKTEKFTELPKGRLIGIICGYNVGVGVLNGGSEILNYIRDNFRGFRAVRVYKVPDNIEVDL